MNVRRFIVTTALFAAFSGALMSCPHVSAQEPVADRDDAVDRISLFGAMEQTANSANQSSVEQSRLSVAELRQARALYRANQRVARLEHNLWMGYEPLRPNWNAVPMMSSRYSNRKLYVPVYVWAR